MQKFLSPLVRLITSNPEVRNASWQSKPVPAFWQCLWKHLPAAGLAPVGDKYFNRQESPVVGAETVSFFQEWIDRQRLSFKNRRVLPVELLVSTGAKPAADTGFDKHCQTADINMENKGESSSRLIYL